jgi:hypothetical protein
MKTFIREKLLQGLDVLADEVREIDARGNLWKTSGDIINPAGTLALHLAGNIQHFIGAVLGHSGYVRKRDYEFSARELSANELLKEIQAARVCVVQTFLQLSEAQLAARYPGPFLGLDHTTLEVLYILYGHLQYHLGQINYLRRM